MENYIVSARKYRPMTFESVVGQQVLTTTLKNAISTNHLAHAYLFCGPRGVGKTTCARIFAKTINCLNPTPDYEACGECESCKAFSEQRSFNIHELDAASNNSVDDIRSLIDQVRIPPQIGKYSVYIIDEVHMLSQGAFNALLKTLEEPPSYAIFILATTEKHKVPATILSRCQVYDFARITVNDIVGYLGRVVARDQEVNITEEALTVVAQKADGGMRDALSIFDQLVAFAGKTIDYQKAIEVLNVLDTDYYFRLVDASLNSDYLTALLIFDEVLGKGFDAQHFLIGLASHLRNVLVSKDEQTISLMETSDSIRQRYREQAQRCSARYLISALNLINEADINYRQSKNKRLTVELALINLCQLLVRREASDQPSITSPAAPSVARPAAPAPAQGAAPQRQAPAPAAPAAPAAQAAPQAAAQRPVTRMPQVKSISEALKQINQQTTAPAAPATPTAPAAPTAPATPTATPAAPAAPTAAPPQPIDVERLEKVWFELSKKLPVSPRLKALIANTRPQLSGTNTILLALDNEMQVQDLQASMSSITSALSQELATEVSLETTIKEHEDANVAYSSMDRYKLLLKQNSALKELTQALDLTLE